MLACSLIHLNEVSHIAHIGVSVRSAVHSNPTLQRRFVDDDMMLRKMFSRVLRSAAPTWSIREASNGETAFSIAKEERFDLIFVDHYMAAVEKQWLGTETVAAMRAHGVDSVICGLSANDVEAQFLEAGANAFMFKPFPCKKNELKDALIAILVTMQDVEQAPV
jgi:CheY-like chemotaxis protein